MTFFIHNKTNVCSFICAAVVASAIALPQQAPAKAARQQSEQPTAEKPPAELCGSYMELALKALPADVGDAEKLRRLQNAGVRSDAFSSVTPEKLSIAVKDENFRAEKNSCKRGEDGEEGQFCDPAGIRRLKLNDVDGKLTYLNPERSFKFGESEPIGLSTEAASEIAVTALQRAGLPSKEIISKTVVRTLTLAGSDPERREVTKPVAAEHHVRVGRVLNGIPVFDSEAKAAVTAKGDIARLHLRWPDARVSQALAEAKPRDRKAVAEEAAQLLSNTDRGCKAYEGVKAFIAYAPVTEESDFYGFSSDKEDNARAPFAYFAPSIVLYAEPRAAKEDSGEIVPPGLQAVVPLFDRAENSPKRDG